MPPRYSPFWARVIQWYLPAYLRRSHGVVSFECAGAERLASSLQAGDSVLLASNHSRPCDPMVLSLLSREVGRPFHVMASWHLFIQNQVLGFLLPRMGCFSVYREGVDRESLKCAIRVLAEARFPLVIFPEGFVTRNNDRVMNLMDGVTFLARSAAKQRAAAPRGGSVVIHPVFIRYFFEGNLKATLDPVIRHIEARLSWQPRNEIPFKARIERAGHALLALKEIEYLGAPQTGALTERLHFLLNRLLEPLEQERSGGRREGDAMARVKRLRSAILHEMVHGELGEEEISRRWRQLSDLYLAQQLHCYSGDYLQGDPSPERMIETVERYEEDLTDSARPHPPLHAVIMVGQGIEITPGSKPNGDGDPVGTELRRQLEAMLKETTTKRRVQPVL